MLRFAFTQRNADPATRHVLTLEAIVEALRGIENPPAPDGAALTPSPAKGKAKA